VKSHRRGRDGRSSVAIPPERRRDREPNASIPVIFGSWSGTVLIVDHVCTETVRRTVVCLPFFLYAPCENQQLTWNQHDPTVRSRPWPPFKNIQGAAKRLPIYEGFSYFS
jgi:hypothetical protein